MCPKLRLLAQHPKIDLLVAYCTLQGAEKGVDPEFGVEVAWDIPLLEGYSWVHVPNRSPRPGLGKFFGLINPGLWGFIRKGRFDVVVVPGYAYLSYWVAIWAARFSGAALILGTDATSLIPRDGKQWKVLLKRWLLPKVFRLADAVRAPSSGTFQFFRSLGIPQERIFLTHYTVDNDYFARMAKEVDRASVRERWNIPEEAAVVLFVAKLQRWKRPQDLLRAFAQAGVDGAYLVFAGEGPLRKELEAEAQGLGVAERVRFLGFVNQSRMPEVYVASDLLVLPSEHEPFGLVVNEAMVCRVPAVVSDQVGARFDLIREGETGFVYPCGDVETLAGILRKLLPDRERLKQMGGAARKRMETWSYREHIEGLVEAVEKAVAFKNERRDGSFHALDIKAQR
jgi:glycosyltransferase involved in cell wall biosynthesis